MLLKSCMTVIAASLLAFVSTAHGGQITNLQVYDGGGAPTATINYSGADGNGSYSAYVYADPQVSYGTSDPLYYCVDLWHDNYIGSTYTITPVSSMAFANSTFARRRQPHRLALVAGPEHGRSSRRRAARDLVHGR